MQPDGNDNPFIRYVLSTTSVLEQDEDLNQTITELFSFWYSFSPIDSLEVMMSSRLAI